MMRATFLAFALALVGAQGTAAQDRTAAAEMNYGAILSGAKQISQLNAQELADVIELDRRRRARQPDTRTASQRCIDAEVAKAGGETSTLARRVIDMKRREAGD
jgi:hypothetical protein